MPQAPGGGAPETKLLPAASQRSAAAPGAEDPWQPMETTATARAPAGSAPPESGSVAGRQGRQQTARDSGTNPPPLSYAAPAHFQASLVAGAVRCGGAQRSSHGQPRNAATGMGRGGAMMRTPAVDTRTVDPSAAANNQWGVAQARARQARSAQLARTQSRGRRASLRKGRLRARPRRAAHPGALALEAGDEPALLAAGQPVGRAGRLLAVAQLQLHARAQCRRRRRLRPHDRAARRGRLHACAAAGAGYG